MSSTINASTSAGIVQTADTSGVLQLQTANTAAVTIDASQNVGIGTSSPSYKLDVNGGIKAANAFIATGSISSGATGANSGWIDSDGSGGLRIRSLGTNASTNGQVIFTQAKSDNSGITEAMRIDSSGRLLVGTTSSADSKVTIHSSTAGSWASVLRTTADAGTYYLQAFRRADNDAQVGYISSNGTTTSYVTSSDYRLKENIQPMQNALATVAQLNPVTYTWKADGSDGQGFIAHELQAVVPDCVTGEKDAVDAEGKPVYQGIDTSFLVATLTKAIQELSAKNDALEARLSKLEAK